jgi:ethanolamine utilization protein EutQ
MKEQTMKKTLHYKRSEMEFGKFGDPPGESGIARLVGPDVSTTMGVGLATFDGCSIDWTVLYDEMIVVIEGKFRLKTPEGAIEATPGDVIWIPEKTPISYEGEKATVCYALYPVDWRKRHNL